MGTKFKCDQCGKSLTTKYSLKNHKLVVHDGYYRFQCPHCEFKASQMVNLRRHSCSVRRVDGQMVYESAIQKKLERSLRGRPRKCPAGNVDVVTDRFIIEIKAWTNWQKAVGQIMCYSVYFPRHKPLIHFFGRRLARKKERMILNTLHELGIMCTWES